MEGTRTIFLSLFSSRLNHHQRGRDDRDERLSYSSTHGAAASYGRVYRMQLNLPQWLQMFKLTLPDTVIAPMEGGGVGWSGGGGEVSLNNGQRG